jgi:hypothetical protein
MLDSFQMREYSENCVLNNDEQMVCTTLGAANIASGKAAASRHMRINCGIVGRAKIGHRS